LLHLDSSPAQPRLEAQSRMNKLFQEMHLVCLLCLRRLEDPLATGLAVAEIDLGKLEAVRARMPIAQHRRLGRVCLGWD
jgi:hypothetical protein